LRAGSAAAGSALTGGVSPDEFSGDTEDFFGVFFFDMINLSKCKYFVYPMLC